MVKLRLCDRWSITIELGLTGGETQSQVLLAMFASVIVATITSPVVRRVIDAAPVLWQVFTVACTMRIDVRCCKAILQALVVTRPIPVRVRPSLHLLNLYAPVVELSWSVSRVVSS
jgi:hypothetical protein